MDIEQFKLTGFTSGMRLEYEGKEYDIVSVDFKEFLFAIHIYSDPDELSWIHCENATLIL